VINFKYGKKLNIKSKKKLFFLFKVRTTGPVDALTNQPVKGRRREGGIRVGEMERDALLGHGVAGILLDRLLHCSDETRAYICTRCGSLLSLVKTKLGYVCRYCCGSSSNTVQRVTIPYVLQYLIAELASVGIKTHFDTKTVVRNCILSSQ